MTTQPAAEPGPAARTTPTRPAAPASSTPPGPSAAPAPSVLPPAPTGPISIGGVPLDKRLVTAVHELAARVVTRLTERIPVYASLPAEQLRGDITAVVVRGIRSFAQVLRTGQPPTADQLELTHRSAVRRAQEHIPLDAVVGAYFLGAYECLDEVLAEAGPDDLADVLTAQKLLLRYLNAVTESVFAGYIAESRAALGERQSARQALLSALLDGGPARQAAERAGMRLPERYWVVSVAAAPHPDERTPGVDTGIAAGRKLRRMRAELDRWAHGEALSALSPDGGVALVPAAAALRSGGTPAGVDPRTGIDRLAGTDDAGAGAGSPVGQGPRAGSSSGQGLRAGSSAGPQDPGAAAGAYPGQDPRADADFDRLAGLLRDMARACGAELTAAAVAAPPQDVAGAARLAARVRQVAESCGRGPGLYRLDDVLLEYQLTLPSPARDRLAALLRPLEGREDLLETLRTFLACGLDRRRTAERLHVHPNTVDYRLRRTSALTGLNAAHGPDLPRLQAALAAYGA
ncbi:putative transcriptional regulator [Actinacidiphila reveromycinica]|uniref:Putative transcriptional regulator n=1 Tax=Actinacidiphila reveromycinica TaxID=659352 RepID=A0A7U3UZR7_9ACTN|nr:helix-turn-helix domain-containing protein [Streptomyces sp. SN-593]BBB01584.1 putative transcriptional regulator [Streptomyces sp. SN-593]